MGPSVQLPFPWIVFSTASSVSAIEYFSDGELNTVLFHYWADLITRKVFLRSSYNEHPCNLSLDLTFGASGNLSPIQWVPWEGPIREEREEGRREGKCCDRVGPSGGSREANGRIRVGVWLDLWEAVGTRGSHRRGDRDREGTLGEKDFLSTKQQDSFWLVSGNIFIRCLRPALSSFQLITSN